MPMPMSNAGSNDEVNPELALLMQMASRMNPDTGQPTVAAGVANQVLAPAMPQGPQGGPPQGMPGGPSVQDVAANAGLGNQLQMAAMQQGGPQGGPPQGPPQGAPQGGPPQGMDPRLAQAMRFGLAAAPGAQQIQGAADGGIIGYAGGGSPQPHPLNDPEKLKEARERLARMREAQRGASTAGAAASAAPEARGIGALLRRIPKSGPIGAALTALSVAGMSPEERGQLEDQFRTLLGFDPANPAQASYSNEGRNWLIEKEARENYSNEGRNYPNPIVRETPPPQQVSAGSGQGGGGPQMPQMPGMGQMGPSQRDAALGNASRILQGMETKLPSGAQTGTRAGDITAGQNEFFRSQGLDPEEYKRRIAESEARQARQLAGIQDIRQGYADARSGMNGLMQLLSAGSNSTNPLARVGQQYTNMQYQGLAEKERFFAAEENVRIAHDNLKAAVIEKRRGELTKNWDVAREAEAKEMEARNRLREAQVNLEVEKAKIFGKSEESAIDRAFNLQLEQMRLSAQRASTAAQREGTNELRRGNALAKLQMDTERLMRDAERVYQDSLGKVFGNRPADEAQRQQIRTDHAQRVARIEATAAKARSDIMTGGTSEGVVTRIK